MARVSSRNTSQNYASNTTFMTFVMPKSEYVIGTHAVLDKSKSESFEESSVIITP